MFDSISIGDVTVDNYIRLKDAEVKCNIDKTDCKLCLEYGQKIPVEHFSHQIGGNAANNAVGSARLKLNTAIYVNVGDDATGLQIKHQLKQDGLDIRYVVVNKGMESNLSTVISFQGERTILVYHQPWKYELPDLDKSKWIYLTSLSPTVVQSNLIQDLTRHLEMTHSNLLYNPGTFQIKSGIKKNPRLLSLTKILIVNLEEAKTILDFKEEENIPVKQLLKKITDLGPQMTVITEGDKGSFGYDGEKYYGLGVFPAKKVEVTGAGDGYATGVLAGLFHGKDLPEAMRWGAANGASVVECIGPQAGLLTYNQMQEKLKENSKIIAKEI